MSARRSGSSRQASCSRADSRTAGRPALKTSGGELPFQPTNIGFAGWEAIDGGQLVYYITTAATVVRACSR